MSLAPGTKLGPYEIVSALGAGGMGEVYRARDSKLKREVAIKVLPPDVANDRERLARFQREAEVLAALNHPHIAQIYGIEENALVMELVEGEDLSQRIARGPIPIDEALPIARQIAEALEAAHEQGIIHRDLKPANIKVRPDGTVKVLDFGLAKAFDPESGLRAPGSGNLANSPTITSPAMTMHGMILGTAAYMSPEQAKGKAVDKRADVWAFGVVLYEMLTGTKAFPGEDVSDTLATLLKFDPDWSKLPADTPPAIRRLLKRCLTKDPKVRLRECGSAIVDIHEAMSGDDATMIAASSAAGGKARRRGARWLLPALATALIALAGVTAWALWGNRAANTPQPTRRFTITLPDTYTLPVSQGTLLGISPDDRTLVYRAQAADNTTRLFRRSRDQFDATIIAGIDDAREPYTFSPDGQWLMFRLDTSLRKIALVGGPPILIAAKGAAARGASWGPDDRIVFGGDIAGGGLAAVPAAGGEVTTLFEGEQPRRAWYPQVLPGGNAVLFTLSVNTPDGGELQLLTLESGARRTVMANASAGRVLPSGHLVFVRTGAIWAVPFDRNRLEAVGTAIPVVEGVRVEVGGAVQFAVSDAGTLIYIPGQTVSNEKVLVSAGPDGTFKPVPAPKRNYHNVVLSPDQTRAVVQVDDGDDADVWVADLARGTLTRVTTEAGYDGSAIWSPDGASVVYASFRGERRTLVRKSADGTGGAEVLATFDKTNWLRPQSWSPDGRVLLADTDGGIVMVNADGKGEPKVLIQRTWQPMVSPDGRWITYTSTESGQNEIYMQRFPGLGDRRIVSTDFAHMSSWSRDGRYVYYLRGGPPNTVMRVSIRPNQSGGVDIGNPEVFAPFRYDSRIGSHRAYDVFPDGKRMLAVSRTAEPDSATLRHINVVVNWFDELKRLVPVK